MAGDAETILLEILVILVAAKAGGEIAERLKQPSVLGELLFGVVVGPSLLALIHPPILVTRILTDPSGGLGSLTLGSFADLNVVRVLSELGVIVLLFEVGLETNVRDMAKVGGSAFLVATLGVVVSFFAGYFASDILAHYGFWPDETIIHVFIGAMLTATSVGITARVLSDLGKLASPEARIILGAAVIDDVMGLLILAVVVALAAGTLTAGGIAVIAAKAVGFLVAAYVIGLWIVPRIFDFLMDRSRVGGMTLSTAVVFMLALAYSSSLVDLAPIVGAFAGGMILAQSRYRGQIFEQMRPVGYLLIPFFFVVLGVQVDLSEAGADAWRIVVVGTVLSLVAILAKLAAGLGVLRGEASRYVVGVGMAPRGEVGLIFALLGLAITLPDGTPLLANWEYTSIIVVVLATTLVTPVWLKAIAGRIARPSEPVTESVGRAAEILRTP